VAIRQKMQSVMGPVRAILPLTAAAIYGGRIRRVGPVIWLEMTSSRMALRGKSPLRAPPGETVGPAGVGPHRSASQATSIGGALPAPGWCEAGALSGPRRTCQWLKARRACPRARRTARTPRCARFQRNDITDAQPAAFSTSPRIGRLAGPNYQLQGHGLGRSTMNGPGLAGLPVAPPGRSPRSARTCRGPGQRTRE
jgi:hypothetical protein